MFATTYHIFKDQILSLNNKKSDYAKILLAPLTTYVLLVLLAHFSVEFMAKLTTNFDHFSKLQTLIATLIIILFIMLNVYLPKSLVQTIRLIVINESPSSYFNIDLFKESFLFISYLLFIFIFLPLFESNQILELLWFIFAISCHPFNLVSVSSDVEVRFFGITIQLGKWYLVNIVIGIIFSLLYFGCYLLSKHIPILLLSVIIYFVILNHVAVYARSFLTWKESV